MVGKLLDVSEIRLFVAGLNPLRSKSICILVRNWDIPTTLYSFWVIVSCKVDKYGFFTRIFLLPRSGFVQRHITALR